MRHCFQLYCTSRCCLVQNWNNIFRLGVVIGHVYFHGSCIALRLEIIPQGSILSSTRMARDIVRMLHCWSSHRNRQQGCTILTSGLAADGFLPLLCVLCNLFPYWWGKTMRMTQPWSEMVHSCQCLQLTKTFYLF